MTPTPEQVAQWAREAGFFLYDLTETHGEKVIESDDKDQHAQLHRLVTRAMAEQAARIAALEAENVGLRKDAERYRFVRAMTMTDDYDNIEVAEKEPTTFEEFDAEVDGYIVRAALKETP